MPHALPLAEVHESRACTGRALLSTAPALHGMSARPLLAAASTRPPVRHARVLSHARCGACGGVLPRQDSRPTACTCGSPSLPRRGASARMRRRASLRREGGGGRVSRAPRSARPDPTRAHPAASRVGPYGHRRTRAPRSSPVVSCDAASLRTRPLHARVIKLPFVGLPRVLQELHWRESHAMSAGQPGQPQPRVAVIISCL